VTCELPNKEFVYSTIFHGPGCAGKNGINDVYRKVK
jgi:hypothetical protein